MFTQMKVMLGCALGVTLSADMLFAAGYTYSPKVEPYSLTNLANYTVNGVAATTMPTYGGTDQISLSPGNIFNHPETPVFLDAGTVECYDFVNAGSPNLCCRLSGGTLHPSRAIIVNNCGNICQRCKCMNMHCMQIYFFIISGHGE